MKHKVKLEWYAFRYDFNTKQLQIFNVMQDDLIEDIEKAYRKKLLKDLNSLKDMIRVWAAYHYWSKAEHEVIVSSLFADNNSEGVKIDVYYQLEMNLDRITEYVNKEMQLGL